MSGRVLIIDDDPAVLSALPETLRLWMPGLVVELCGSARLALDRIESTDYDAVISDIRMPDMDGLTLLERIRACRSNTPVLLITGYGDQTMATQALRGGAFDYILKPIDRDYFLGAVGRALHLRQLGRHAEERQRADAALRASQQSLHAIIETIPCLLIITDSDGRILVFNRTAEERTGYASKDMVGHLVFDLLVPPAWLDDAKRRHSNPTSDVPYQHPWKTKSGEERLIEWRCTELRWPNHENPCVLGIGIDITERQRAEDKIASLHRELTQQSHAYGNVVRELEGSKRQLQEKIFDLEAFQGRESKMIALEKQVVTLEHELETMKMKRLPR